jgi:hypothetical protein
LRSPPYVRDFPPQPRRLRLRQVQPELGVQTTAPRPPAASSAPRRRWMMPPASNRNPVHGPSVSTRVPCGPWPRGGSPRRLLQRRRPTARVHAPGRAQAVMALSVPDFTKLRESFNSSELGKLWEEPSVQSFIEEFSEGSSKRTGRVAQRVGHRHQGSQAPHGHPGLRDVRPGGALKGQEGEVQPCGVLRRGCRGTTPRRGRT